MKGVFLVVAAVLLRVSEMSDSLARVANFGAWVAGARAMSAEDLILLASRTIAEGHPFQAKEWKVLLAAVGRELDRLGERGPARRLVKLDPTRKDFGTMLAGAATEVTEEDGRRLLEQLHQLAVTEVSVRLKASVRRSGVAVEA